MDRRGERKHVSVTICRINPILVEIWGINRKTFYNYFNGIYQLVDEIENDIVRDFDRLLEESDIQLSLENPNQVFKKLAQLLNSDLEFYGQLFSDDNNGLTVKIVSLLKQRAKDTICQQFGSDPNTVEVVLEFTFSGMLAVFRRWFNSEHRESVEEISSLVSTLCFRGVEELFRKESRKAS